MRNSLGDYYSRLGIPTLYEVKAGDKFLKGVLKDNFWILFIRNLKTKGGTKGKIFKLSHDLKAGDEVSKRKAGELASLLKVN
jgi:hypothetical protein